MPEIEFTINTETGKCDTEIKGVQGPACEHAARQLTEMLGSPALDRKTKEYYVKAQTKRRIEAR